MNKLIAKPSDDPTKLPKVSRLNTPSALVFKSLHSVYAEFMTVVRMHFLTRIAGTAGA